MNGAARYTARHLEATLIAQGRKQRWLAEQVGISRSLLSKLLKGQRTIDGALAQRISEILGVPFFVLFELHVRSELGSREEQVA